MASFDYEDFVISIPDYPEPGVVFKDITPLLADDQGFAAAIDDIADYFSGCGITKVVGAEARGFLVGAPVAYRLGVGFVPARKPGKLPRETLSQSYDLEYGTDALEIHRDAIGPGDVVLVVDDLLATGGTAEAAVKLVERAGGIVTGFGFLMELSYLNPRDAIARVSNAEVYSLIEIK